MDYLLYPLAIAFLTIGSTLPFVAEILNKRPSERGPISRIRPSDGCGGMQFPRRRNGDTFFLNLKVIREMSA